MSPVGIRAARAAAAVAFVFVSFARIGYALAQEDSVVVSATRFPEEVWRLPASVTVISAEDMARSSARTLPELLSEQAGLAMRDLYGNNAALASVLGALDDVAAEGAVTGETELTEYAKRQAAVKAKAATDVLFGGRDLEGLSASLDLPTGRGNYLDAGGLHTRKWIVDFDLE